MNAKENARPTAATVERAAETADYSRAAISCSHSITSANGRQVSAYLPIGAANAVSGKDLAALLGYKTVRKLSREIELERRSGLPICAANGENKGYFLAASADELERYVKRLNRRIREIRKTHDAVSETLRKLSGQTVLEGW